MAMAMAIGSNSCVTDGDNTTRDALRTLRKLEGFIFSLDVPQKVPDHCRDAFREILFSRRHDDQPPTYPVPAETVLRRNLIILFRAALHYANFSEPLSGRPDVARAIAQDCFSSGTVTDAVSHIMNCTADARLRFTSQASNSSSSAAHSSSSSSSAAASGSASTIPTSAPTRDVLLHDLVDRFLQLRETGEDPFITRTKFDSDTKLRAAFQAARVEFRDILQSGLLHVFDPDVPHLNHPPSSSPRTNSPPNPIATRPSSAAIFSRPSYPIKREMEEQGRPPPKRPRRENTAFEAMAETMETTVQSIVHKTISSSSELGDVLHRSDLGVFQEQVSCHRDKLDQHQAQLDKNVGHLGKVDKRVASLQNHLQDHGTKLDTCSRMVDKLDADSKNFVASLKALKQDNGDARQIAAGLKSKAQTAENKAEALKAKVQSLENKVRNLEAGATKRDTEAAEHVLGASRVKEGLEAKFKGLESKLHGLEAKVRSLESTASEARAGDPSPECVKDQIQSCIRDSLRASEARILAQCASRIEQRLGERMEEQRLGLASILRQQEVDFGKSVDLKVKQHVQQQDERRKIEDKKRREQDEKERRAGDEKQMAEDDQKRKAEDAKRNQENKKQRAEEKARLAEQVKILRTEMRALFKDCTDSDDRLVKMVAGAAKMIDVKKLLLDVVFSCETGLQRRIDDVQQEAMSEISSMETRLKSSDELEIEMHKIRSNVAVANERLDKFEEHVRDERVEPINKSTTRYQQQKQTNPQRGQQTQEDPQKMDVLFKAVARVNSEHDGMNGRINGIEKQMRKTREDITLIRLKMADSQQNSKKTSKEAAAKASHT